MWKYSCWQGWIWSQNKLSGECLWLSKQMLQLLGQAQGAHVNSAWGYATPPGTEERGRFTNIMGCRAFLKNWYIKGEVFQNLLTTPCQRVERPRQHKTLHKCKWTDNLTKWEQKYTEVNIQREKLTWCENSRYRVYRRSPQSILYKHGKYIIRQLSDPVSLSD